MLWVFIHHMATDEAEEVAARFTVKIETCVVLLVKLVRQHQENLPQLVAGVIERFAAELQHTVEDATADLRFWYFAGTL